MICKNISINDLKKIKERFFIDNINYIKNNCDREIIQYVNDFLSGNYYYFDFNEENITQEKGFFNKKVIYACFREKNRHWKGFFQSIKKDIIGKKLLTNKKIFKNTHAECIGIRQCRPDKKEYTIDQYHNVGFYNKNPFYEYINYDEYNLFRYLKKEFGDVVVNNFNYIKSNESKSDFFLSAILYKSGGISSDVCSVAECDITPLIEGVDITFVYDEQGINKKFLFSKPYEDFFGKYFENLNEKSTVPGIHDQRTGFSDREQFNKFFLDYFCFFGFENKKINFIHNSVFEAFVSPSEAEENIFEKQEQNIKTKSLKGIFRNDAYGLPEGKKKYSDHNNFFMPKSHNVQLVGLDVTPHISQRHTKSYSLSSRDVFEMANVALSGHACLWNDGFLLDLESDLCTVAENEARAGFWKKPTSDNITKKIEEDCIIAFSPGYGCYGHYLVDDLPRIGLIRDHIGPQAFKEKKFIIPKATPSWGRDLLKYFFDLPEDNFLLFEHTQEIWEINRVLISSYPHKNYNFHPYIKEFYDKYKINTNKPYRKVCLSRKTWEPTKRGQRVFRQQKFFEEMALKLGYEIIEPEKLSIAEQIKLMQETVCQVGEHGSAQHSSLFNTNGMTIGTIHPRTEVQIGIGRIYNDDNIICYADSENTDQNNNIFYDLSEEKIIEFFEAVEKKHVARIKKDNTMVPELCGELSDTQER